MGVSSTNAEKKKHNATSHHRLLIRRAEPFFFLRRYAHFHGQLARSFRIYTRGAPILEFFWPSHIVYKYFIAITMQQSFGHDFQVKRILFSHFSVRTRNGAMNSMRCRTWTSAVAGQNVPFILCIMRTIGGRTV